MEITNAESARSWLHAWDGRPRRGVLSKAIEGLTTSESILRSKGDFQTAMDTSNALTVLKDAWRLHYGSA